MQYILFVTCLGDRTQQPLIAEILHILKAIGPYSPYELQKHQISPSSSQITALVSEIMFYWLKISK